MNWRVIGVGLLVVIGMAVNVLAIDMKLPSDVKTQPIQMPGYDADKTEVIYVTKTKTVTWPDGVLGCHYYAYAADNKTSFNNDGKFWEASEEVITKNRTIQSITFGNYSNGDIQTTAEPANTTKRGNPVVLRYW